MVLSSFFFQRNLKELARKAMEICLRALKENNKSRFDSYSVRNSVLIISHVTFRDCHMHIFSDNLSRNSCIQFNNKFMCKSSVIVAGVVSVVNGRDRDQGSDTSVPCYLFLAR